VTGERELSRYGRMVVVADDHGAVFSVIMAPANNA
jgi:hypothetical protein